MNHCYIQTSNGSRLVMAETKLKESIGEEEEKKKREDQSFEELGVDARLLRALHKKGIAKPTPIQDVAIPLILRATLVGPPDILISTPTCVAKCLSGGILKADSISESLETLVLDEVKPDLVNWHLLPFNFNVLSAASADVDKLKKLILHNPFILTLPEVGNDKEEIIPKNVQ
ncbi:hypothetical protein ACSQ67_015144 [Phaseolus vulgaris]